MPRSSTLWCPYTYREKSRKTNRTASIGGERPTHPAEAALTHSEIVMSRHSFLSRLTRIAILAAIRGAAVSAGSAPITLAVWWITHK